MLFIIICLVLIWPIITLSIYMFGFTRGYQMGIRDARIIYAPKK